MDSITIKGARQHNLKDVNLTIPKNKLVVFTGLSGSGKSSLAFDTIYAEGQRRYVESLSSYARQFLGIMDKPDVDAITGLSPAISIDQKSTSHNPRSTVGTVTEIYDYLRLLFARIGHPHCPNCAREITRQSPQQVARQIFELAIETGKTMRTKQVRMLLMSPVVRGRKGEFTGLFDNLKAKGFTQVRIDGFFYGLAEDILLIRTNKHDIDVVVDRLVFDAQILKQVHLLTGRVTDAVEQAMNLSDGLVTVGVVEDSAFTFPAKPKKVTDHLYSQQFACPVCNISIAQIEPRTFSFNSPQGACPECSGLGVIVSVDENLVLNKNLSITEGGILPFAKTFFHDSWYSRVILFVCKKMGIDPRAPLSVMSAKQREALLYGTGDEIHTVVGLNRFGESTQIHEEYRGVTAELKRRHRESNSDFIRAEIEKYMRQEVCLSCRGKRLKKEALGATVDGFSIADVADLSIGDTLHFMSALVGKLSSATETMIAKPIVKEINTRLTFLTDVGLEYLTLSRSAATLSGGEAQRIRLASQIGSGLTGVLYVLDEPSIGLHQRDNRKLIDTLYSLRDLDNTVIVVEHDRETIESSDYVVDFGPGAGEHGGMVVAQGTVSEVKKNKASLTAKYLTNEKTISRVTVGPSPFVSDTQTLTVVGARQNNLKDITVKFPLGRFTCVTGVSGSGKSTLIVDILYEALFAHFYPQARRTPGAFETIEGLAAVDKVILIDQSAIGRTPRSNPATYVGLFSLIRELYAQLSESKLRGFKPGRFSFNVSGGRCEACEGEGQRKIEMQFLSDIYVTCEVCHGTRYNTQTLEVLYHGKNIAQILDMTAQTALEFFSHHPQIVRKIRTLVDVGLGYVHLGQPAPTLSGGEAQRVKLSSELSRVQTGKTVYILDEPTTGLHFADLEKLLDVLHRLTESGNTVIVIEHNLDMIKNADWIIDLGPEGGDLGGYVVTSGTPAEVSKHNKSYTGMFLKNLLQR